MAAATSSAAGGPGGDADDFSRVYDAVASGASEAELRRVIEECAQGDDQRRAQAVNHSSTATETPLQAADRQKRGDQVGALVEAGADVAGIFAGRKLTPLAVCIAYGQVESVRALLRAGHDANEEIEWAPWGLLVDAFSTPAHFCLAPPPLGLPSDRVVDYIRRQDMMRIGAPQIGCLEVLLREGGARVESRDSYGYTILWLARFGSSYDDEEEKAARDLLVSAGARTSGVFGNKGCSPLMTAAACNNARFARFLIEEAGAPVDERSPRNGLTALHECGGDEVAALLLDAGAAIEARTNDGSTPLFMSVARKNMPTTRLLLDRGAVIDVIDKFGRTPLNMACVSGIWLRDEGWPLFQEILRRSSAKTRCARWRNGYYMSAVDLLARSLNRYLLPSQEADMRAQKRRCWAIAELLASGAPVRPKYAARALPIAAQLSARQEAELAARRAELSSWRAHETFVGMSLDVKELRKAERELEEKRARVAALERELRELEGGQRETEGSSGGSEGGEGDDESESDCAEEGCAGVTALERRMSGLGLGDWRATVEREAATAVTARGAGGGGAE